MRGEDRKEYEDTPEGWASRWTDEFAVAKKSLNKWHKEADKVVDNFLGQDRQDDSDYEVDRLNLFFANITTLQAMLYGNAPKIEVDRTFSDADDDQARVASSILSRMLNQDVQKAGDNYASILHDVLQDRLLPGFGNARVRYLFDEVQVPVEAVVDPMTGMEIQPATTQTEIRNERVEFVYTFWKDILWSPSRVYKDIWWKAYRAYMDYDELVERFGDKVAKKIPLSEKNVIDKDGGKAVCTPQAEVWEVWNRKNRKVQWFVEGYNELLDDKDDPLELEAFFPDPPPLVANLTTRKFIPRSDYKMAQDLYRQIDVLQTRITRLTESCKLVGAYDAGNKGVERMLNEATENELVPVDNWAMYAEKGGTKGIVDWLPIEAVANVISILTDKQAEKIQQLYQVTGMSDILRGFSQPYEAAATSKAKVQFASIKVQALQDEFARFASDLQSIKMEVIQKHFQPYCIIEQSNIMMTPDAEIAEQAVELVKDRERAKWRVTIRPESLALADYAQLKADRTEYMFAIAQFMQSAAPLVELDQSATPVLLELLKWGLAGFKGSKEIEGVVDRAVRMAQEAAAKKAAEPPPPSPEEIKAKAEAEKTQMEMQMKDRESQSRMQLEQMQMEQDKRKALMEFALERRKFEAEMQRDERKFQQEMIQAQQKHELEMEHIRAKLSADQQSAQIKMEAQTHAAAVQMERDDAKARADRANGGGEE
jgi:hypothetical protein